MHYCKLRANFRLSRASFRFPSSLKSIQMNLMLRQHPLKLYKLLKCFISLLATAKIQSFVRHLKEESWDKVTYTCKFFKKNHRNHKKMLRVYMVCGDAVSTLDTFGWSLNHVSRSITWSLLTPKFIKLGQMTTLNVIFHVVVSDYRLVKLWNPPQFPAQFGMANNNVPKF